MGPRWCCALCLATDGPEAGAADCPGWCARLEGWVQAAASQGHTLQCGLLHTQRGQESADDLPIAFCARCGAWATAARRGARAKLLGPCAGPTRAGREVLARLGRGLHPKPGYDPPYFAPGVPQ